MQRFTGQKFGIAEKQIFKSLLGLRYNFKQLNKLITKVQTK